MRSGCNLSALRAVPAYLQRPHYMPWSEPEKIEAAAPDNTYGYQASFKKVWATTLRKAGIPYFRIYDLRSTYATRLSAGGVADEWVTQLLRQGDAEVFKKYSQPSVDT